MRPWVMNLSGSSKKGGGRCIFKVVIFLSKIRPPHMQFAQSYLFIASFPGPTQLSTTFLSIFRLPTGRAWERANLCTHAMILQCLFCHALAYAITANGVCLHLLVPPLARCCFFSVLASCNCMYCGINRWEYF